ncbi:glycosyltransferase family 4 protein [Sutcliffiella horikoshii]|uniref:glycosyltransferase family 4 protein n=1 Tax=Sutcliffiella horikoshii TaxID=79883 RepID=UPI003CF25CEF
MVKMLYLTNIPTPYRNKRFNMMNKIFKDYGIDLTVYFMRKTENGRYWDIDSMDLEYNYYIDKGFYAHYRGIHWHFNPSIFNSLRKNKYDIVIVGGISSPSHWLAPYFLKENQFKILSVESNPQSEVRKSKFARSIKSKLIKKYDTFQITGNRCRDYLKQIDTSTENKPMITLPNLIDEDSLNVEDSNKAEIRSEIRKRYKVKENEQLWILPARLEPVKGLDIFLPATKGLSNVKILVAGEGKQKSNLESLIKREDLPVNIIGQVNSNEMLNLYLSADLFVLPSIQDPSPLSPIEASFIGLPLLVSSRIGNYDDVYVDQPNEKNGWGFDPYQEQDEIKSLLQDISKLEIEELRNMGNISKMNYDKNFNIEQRLTSYASQILEFLKQK